MINAPTQRLLLQVQFSAPTCPFTVISISYWQFSQLQYTVNSILLAPVKCLEDLKWIQIKHQYLRWNISTERNCSYWLCCPFWHLLSKVCHTLYFLKIHRPRGNVLSSRRNNHWPDLKFMGFSRTQMFLPKSSPRTFFFFFLLLEFTLSAISNYACP